MTRDRETEDDLARAAGKRRQREARREPFGTREVARALAYVGSLAWLVVVPALLGILLGRWLDAVLQTRFAMTALGIVLGIGLGCYLAWRRIEEENRR